MRRVHVQRCPVLMNAQRTHSITACRRSASSITMAALLPPISRATMRPGRSRLASMMRRPTGQLPVKSTPSTSACATRAAATSPRPCTVLNTPAGMPASFINSVSNAPTAGVFSLGLKTTVFPAESAGTQCPFGKCAGKLNGPITAITPYGRYEQLLDRVAVAGI